MSYDEHLISMAGGDGDVLDQIQARADKATAGPWDRFDAQIRHTQIDGFNDPDGRRKAQEQTERDIQFVMHARTDIPALLAVVREQRAQLDQYRANTEAEKARQKRLHPLRAHPMCPCEQCKPELRKP